MNKWKFTMLLALLMVFFCSGNIAKADGTEGVDVASVFEEAGRYYVTGEYSKSIKLYESILDEGFKSGNLYYNLANAYLRSKNIGRAILNYKRAGEYIPFDSDLQANYKYAKSLMSQSDLAKKDFWLIQWLNMAVEYVALGYMIKIIYVLYLLLIIFIVIVYVYKKPGTYSNMVIFVFMALILLISIPAKNKAEELERGAIVTVKIADVRREPFKESVGYFPLYEGMKITILRHKGCWYRVMRPDGKIGWTEEENVTTLN